MSEAPTSNPYGDYHNQPFWEAARSRKLVMQCCKACGHVQFYGRPFCLECGSDDLEWRPVSGKGTVYSQTIVHVPFVEGFEPPYAVALVDLDEGPRLLTNIVGGACEIGARVKVTWREREGTPPLPVFEPDV